MLNYKTTPVQEIKLEAAYEADVRLLILREDMNHPVVSGNKWWKLKYNLEEALRLQHTTLLTFGGAYSNHIYATAGAAKTLNLKSIGIIRGEETHPLNATMTFARNCGMLLKYVSRETYRHKTENQFLEDLTEEFGNFYLIPEGGTNELALKGCEEFAQTVLSKIDFDYLGLAVGTGGTLAGIARGLPGKKKIVGFSSLRGGAFLEGDINHMLQGSGKKYACEWRIEVGYHFGGYGKTTRELDDFIRDQWRIHAIPLDPVYTSKMFFGVIDLIRKGRFESGSTILLLHTGGLQGGWR